MAIPFMEKKTPSFPLLAWTWQAPETGYPDRADRLLLKALEAEAISMTRTQLQRLMEEGQVTLNQKGTERIIKPNTKLMPGAQVRIVFPSPVPTDLIPENIPLEILFEDEHLAVINKPQGLTVHPSPTQMEHTLVHALLHHMKDLSGIGGVMRPGIVHRLDKNTSGALVISKNDQTHTRLVDAFSKHDIERVYWALCYGAPATLKAGEASPPLKVESWIDRSPTDRKKMSMNVTQGKKAISHFRLLQAFEHPTKANTHLASLIEAKLETGRTHQVRVHLTGLGSSVLGDPVYGTPSSQNFKWLALPQEIRSMVHTLPGQALHARVLGFTHPITQKKLYFEAEPPVAFQQLLGALRKYLA